MNANTKVRELKADDCTPNLLDSFDRHQEVRQCWRREGDGYALTDTCYTEAWGTDKKQAVISGLCSTLASGGGAVGAFAGGALVGFASVESALFGSSNQYVNLSMLHVSYEQRRRGTGRALFAAACEQARKLGAERLYISAHSSRESMAFYRKAGCVDVAEVNQKMAEEEPFDCPLEFIL